MSTRFDPVTDINHQKLLYTISGPSSERPFFDCATDTACELALRRWHELERTMQRLGGQFTFLLLLSSCAPSFNLLDDAQRRQWAASRGSFTMHFHVRTTIGANEREIEWKFVIRRKEEK